MLELDGGVVLTETRLEKKLRVKRGQQLRLTAGTDFIWTPYNV